MSIFRKDDPPHLTQQLKELLKLGYAVKRPSQFHIKVGPANFFWSTGKITIDPSDKHEAKGFDAFLKLLKRLAKRTVEIDFGDED